MTHPFDPDAYLGANKAPAGGFDPDAYLNRTKQQQPQQAPLTLRRGAGLAARGAYPVLGGAAAGALLGLAGGPAAPVTVPLGALAGSMAVPAADALTAGYNYLGGKVGLPQIENSPSQVIDQYLTRAGLSEPQNTTERVISAVGAGLGGVGGTVPAFARLAQTAANPVIRGVAEQMAMKPVAQTIAGAYSPGVSQYVGERTNSPTAGVLAGILSTIPQGVLSSALPRRSTIPTGDDLTIAARKLYKEADDSGIVISPDSFTNFVQSVRPKLDEAGFDHVLHKRVARALAVLEERADTPQTFSQTEILRRIINNAASSKYKDERNIAYILRENLNEYVVNLKENDILGGDPANAGLLDNARDLWSRTGKAETVNELIDRAEIRSKTSGSGYEAALRTEVGSLVLNRNRIRLFSADEQEALRKVAKGGPIGNLLRWIGKFSPRGVVSTAIGGSLGFAALGPLGVPLVYGVGEAARAGSTAITSRSARLAEQLMRSGGGNYPHQMISPYQENLARLLTRGSMPFPVQPVTNNNEGNYP